MTLSFAFFSAELIIATWAKSYFDFKFVKEAIYLKESALEIVYPKLSWRGYFCSFMWFLDLAVIVSLIPDISFMTMQPSLNMILLARSVRMFRLIRVFKVYYLIRYHSKSNKKQLEIMQQYVKDGNRNLLEDLRESGKSHTPGKLAELLCDSITTRVVFVIVIFSVVTPLLVFRPIDEAFSFSTKFLQHVNTQNNLPDYIKTACVSALMKSLDDVNIPNIYLEMIPFKNGAIINNVDQLNSLRDIAIVSESISYYNTTHHANYYTLADYSNDYLLQVLNRHYIAMLCLVCFVAILAAVVINHDSNNLVLKPIAVSVTTTALDSI